MTRTVLRRSLAALAATAALALAGCGVSGTDGAGEVVSSGGAGTAAGLHDAARATAAADTSKMTMEMRMTGVPGAGEVSITASGQFDEAAHRGSMTMDMGAAFEGADDALPEGAGKVEMVIDGTVVYVRSPLFDQIDPSGKPWKRIDSSELGAAGAGGLGAGAASDPGGFVSFLEGAGADVTTVGTEDVRGVSTTHVKVDLDLGALLRDATGARRKALEEQLGTLGLDVDDLPRIPAEAWIGDDDLVRKVSLRFDLGAMGSAMGVPDGEDLAGASMTMTMELYDLGEPVDVQVPKASEVSDLELPGLGGLGGD